MYLSVQEFTMKTFYISEGQTYRNVKFNKTRMNPTDRYYLKKVTNYLDSAWVYFSKIEAM